MKKYRIIASSAVAALCLVGSPGSQAVDQPEYRVKSESFETNPCEIPPAKYNKASGIIGMEVCNPKDEHLGQIKDMVFDLKSERVAYAVLSTGTGFLFLDEKLIAVPLSAFTVSADESHLILNTEKDKLDVALGFPHDQWPGVENPIWGAEPARTKEISPPDLHWDSEAGLVTPDPDTDTPDTDGDD